MRLLGAFVLSELAVDHTDHHKTEFDGGSWSCGLQARTAVPSPAGLEVC